MRLHTTSMKNFQIVIFNLLFNTILIIPALSKESKGMFFFTSVVRISSLLNSVYILCHSQIILLDPTGRVFQMRN